ncbi:type I-F CRISPR-associated endoribonuclease Cas6/Csy4 [Pectinatus frisingensis]|uniref:type I-F CRISPR-associated endoribonuclease Cas6/Csy4 n=1 Tax=Pectinatus frisingensis TaxID=865 RepID=UPI0018C7B6AA|nr:type I-F CRISPR-associated endoribonuclease Cas6/Csy4 [Pectinatus frisingensis]
MMMFYQEITILPSNEVSEAFLLSKTYQQLHISFADKKNNDNCNIYGVSFPEYSIKNNYTSVGNKIRVFANDEASMNSLNLSKWLYRLNDYIHITKVRKIPDRIKGYAVYKRFREKNSISKIRRYADYRNISYKEAQNKLAIKEQECNLPYIQMKSCTNNNKFSLFVQRIKTDAVINWKFNFYGLSNSSAVPEF